MENLLVIRPQAQQPQQKQTVRVLRKRDPYHDWQSAYRADLLRDSKKGSSHHGR